MSAIMENNTHECQDCGMRFYNSHELVNHVRKFCTNANLHSLEGLASYETKKGLAKKQKQPARSVGSMKYEPALSSEELARDAMELERHRDQLSAYRHYSSNNETDLDRQPNSDFTKYQKSGLRNIPHYKDSSRDVVQKSGARIMGDSEISIKPINNFGQSTRENNPYKRQQQENKDSFVSPPSQMPMGYTKRSFGPSMLDKSNSSIAKLSGSQKKDYATNKLLQLDNIASLYDESGGMSMDFRKNLQKMRKFYHKMIAESGLPMGGNYPGVYVESRVQTPISKLDDLQDDEGLSPQKKRGRGTRKELAPDALDRELQNKLSIKLNDQAKSMRQMGSQRTKKSIATSPLRQPNSHSSPKFMPNPYQIPYQQSSPQIIMLPPYPQPQNNSPGNSNQLKYFQQMMEMKNEENRNLIKMLIDTKRNKDKSQVRERLSQIHQSRVSAVKNNPLNQGYNPAEAYHFETPMDNSQPTPEEKILIALQRQELDELRLLSELPEQLQQMKMESVMRLIEQRTQLEKEILSQRMKRLEEQEKNQLHLEERKLQNDEWVSQERKRMINNQMGDYLNQYRNGMIGEEDSDEDEDDQ